MTWLIGKFRAFWALPWVSRLALILVTALAIALVLAWLPRIGTVANLLEQGKASIPDPGMARNLVIVAIIAVLLVWLIPRWQVQRLEVGKDRRFELENEARKTVA